MNKKLFFGAVMSFGLFVSKGQNEINLNLQGVASSPSSQLFSINTDEAPTLVIKYLSVVSGPVRSDGEGMVKGQNANVVLVLTEYVTEIGSTTSPQIRNSLIALREVDPYKAYRLISSGQASIPEGSIVSFHSGNLASIPGISPQEAKTLGSVLEDYKNGKFQKTVATPDVWSGLYKEGEVSENDKFLKTGELNNSLHYILFKDKNVNKDQGVAYKACFSERGRIVKMDSIFFADRSELERPETVFDILQNNTNGFIMRLSCRPLDKGDKKDYFRYTYFDRYKNKQTCRFQLAGKMSLFEPYRTFKIGDTLIHLTTRKTGFLSSDFESSIFKGDTIEKVYPLNPGDSIKSINLTCSSQFGSSSLFGSDSRYMLNVKVGNYYFIGEQEMESKASAGFTQMGAANAAETGYSITRIYCIQGYAVKKIYRVRIPNFSKGPSSTARLYQTSDRSLSMINMAFPVLMDFRANGEIKVKSSAVPGYSLRECVASNLYTCSINGIPFLIYSNPSGNIKLLKVDL